MKKLRGNTQVAFEITPFLSRALRNYPEVPLVGFGWLARGGLVWLSLLLVVVVIHPDKMSVNNFDCTYGGLWCEIPRISLRDNTLNRGAPRIVRHKAEAKLMKGWLVIE